VHVSETKHTARFVCTNDVTMAQFASFYPGAMSEARDIELRPVANRVGPVDYVLVAPNDPEAMLRHTQECRQRGYPFLADPSQQLAFGDGELIRELIDGAAILFSNEYESALIEKKTGWSAEEIRSRVGTWVITLGANGVRVERDGDKPIYVPAVPEVEKVEPTGVGDAFRAGFLAALAWDLSMERAAQLGCLLAVHVVERIGTQEYLLHQEAFLRRCADAYGEEAAAEIAAHVRTPRP
jgi:adenosine kinase